MYPANWLQHFSSENEWICIRININRKQKKSHLKFNPFLLSLSVSQSVSHWESNLDISTQMEKSEFLPFWLPMAGLVLSKGQNSIEWIARRHGQKERKNILFIRLTLFKAINFSFGFSANQTEKNRRFLTLVRAGRSQSVFGKKRKQVRLTKKEEEQEQGIKKREKKKKESSSSSFISNQRLGKIN